MSWASQRRGIYFFIFLIIFLVIVGIPTFFTLYEPPTCTDGLQNGIEEGVDCGGDCPKVCSFQVAPPIVEWSRFFEIDDGVYSAVAFIENPNATAEASNVSYSFKLRDRANILITERKGVLRLATKEAFPVFETGIVAGSRIPRRVDFEFTSEPLWVEGVPETLGLSVSNQRLTNVETFPRLDATLENITLDPIEDIEAIALLFDESGNAVQVSRTVVDFLEGTASTNLIFTWPNPFSEKVTTIDIIPLIINE